MNFRRRTNDPGLNSLHRRVDEGDEAAEQYRREVAEFTAREGVQYRLVSELNEEARRAGINLNLREPGDVLRLDPSKIKNSQVRDSVIGLRRRVENLGREQESAIVRYQRKMESAKKAKRSLSNFDENRRNALHDKRVAGHGYFPEKVPESIELGDKVVWSKKVYVVTGKGGTSMVEITSGNERRIVPVSQVVKKN